MSGTSRCTLTSWRSRRGLDSRALLRQSIRHRPVRYAHTRRPLLS
jgi:hypothetical protein